MSAVSPSGEWGRRGVVVLAVLAVGLAIVAALVFWRDKEPTQDPAGRAEDALPPASTGRVRRETQAKVPMAPLTQTDAHEMAGLTAEEILASSKCRMQVGRTPAIDIALLAVPRTSGGRFVVLDADGEIFGDALPFVPDFLSLGKRNDGTVLVGVGNSGPNSTDQERDVGRPARIYADGHVVYETVEAWSFGVAPDGSSFFVLEPMAGGASRLLTRNLDSGREEHFDLGVEYTPDPNALHTGYGVSYARGAKEVMFTPAGTFDGRGRYRFFPVDGGEIRELGIGSGTPRGHGVANQGIEIDEDVYFAYLPSSEEGYFVHLPEDSGSGEDRRWVVERREFDFGARNRVAVSWRREFRSRPSSDMRLSDDGAWLSLAGATFRALDATTGRTVFEFPTVDKTAERLRLRNVLPADATFSDVGGVQGHSFRGSDLLLYRKIGSTASCSVRERDLAEYRNCVAGLRGRGLYRTVYDVFDMNTIELNSQPKRRVDVDLDDPCAIGRLPSSGLQIRDGALAFLGEGD